MVLDFAVRANKSDPEDYYEDGKWKVRRGASGLKVKNVSIMDTACNLSDKARNIIIDKKLNRDVIELFKPFGDLKVVEKRMLHIFQYLTMTSQVSIGNVLN